MIFQLCHKVNVLTGGAEEKIFEPGSQTVFPREFDFYLLQEKVTHGEHLNVDLSDYILSFKNTVKI